MIPADDLPTLPEPFMRLMSQPVYDAWAAQMRTYALAARAERDAEIERLKQARDIDACEYVELQTQLAQRDNRIAELEERLIVMCVGQIKEDGSTGERLREMLEAYRDAWSPGARDELFARYLAELKQRYRPSPDPPAPASLKEGA